MRNKKIIFLIIGIIIISLIIALSNREVLYSKQAELNDKVYTDIKSVVPSLGIFSLDAQSRSGNEYDHFVCECTTNDWHYIWLYISVSDYKKYFDPTANASRSVMAALSGVKKISFSPVVRIHGTIVSSDSIQLFNDDLKTHIHSDTVINFRSIDIPEQNEPGQK